MSEERTCTKCDTTKPLDEFYEVVGGRDGRMAHCRTCNNHRPPTPTRAIRQRARGRAYAELVNRHRDEFEQILDEFTIAAAAEHAQLQQVAASTRSHDVSVPRLKPGPRRNTDSSVIDRLDVARCATCHGFHDRGHVCDTCGSHPSTAAVVQGEDWRDQALCAQIDTEMFFPEKGGSVKAAKRVCSTCPVSAECLQFAIATGETHGIWGGLTERERRGYSEEQTA